MYDSVPAQKTHKKKLILFANLLKWPILLISSPLSFTPLVKHTIHLNKNTSDAFSFKSVFLLQFNSYDKYHSITLKVTVLCCQSKNLIEHPRVFLHRVKKPLYWNTDYLIDLSCSRCLKWKQTPVSARVHMHPKVCQVLINIFNVHSCVPEIQQVC